MEVLENIHLRAPERPAALRRRRTGSRGWDSPFSSLLPLFAPAHPSRAALFKNLIMMFCFYFYFHGICKHCRNLISTSDSSFTVRNCFPCKSQVREHQSSRYRDLLSGPMPHIGSRTAPLFPTFSFWERRNLAGKPDALREKQNSSGTMVYTEQG